MQYPYAVGQMLRLVQILRGEQDGRSGGSQFPDCMPHLVARLGVQAGGRLVQENHLRIPDQAHRDIKPAPHSTGIGTRPTGPRLGE